MSARILMARGKIAREIMKSHATEHNSLVCTADYSNWYAPLLQIVIAYVSSEYRQTDRQTDRPTDRQTDRQTTTHAEKQSYR